jgi:hypothetical protein
MKVFTVGGKKMLRVLAQKPLKERKCHARLTREYTDGGANICAEKEFETANNSKHSYSLVWRLSLTPRGYPFRRPCIHG